MHWLQLSKPAGFRQMSVLINFPSDSVSRTSISTLGSSRCRKLPGVPSFGAGLSPSISENEQRLIFSEIECKDFLPGTNFVLFCCKFLVRLLARVSTIKHRFKASRDSESNSKDSGGFCRGSLKPQWKSSIGFIEKPCYSTRWCKRGEGGGGYLDFLEAPGVNSDLHSFTFWAQFPTSFLS